MKQSLKSRMPELTGMMPFADYVKEADGGLRFMGYCDRNFPRKEFDKEYDGVSDVSLLIGPEGDFSPTEVAAVVEAGFIPVTFGNTRLRTETAALYALCATHSAINRLHQ